LLWVVPATAVVFWLTLLSVTFAWCGLDRCTNVGLIAGPSVGFAALLLLLGAAACGAIVRYAPWTLGSSVRRWAAVLTSLAVVVGCVMSIASP
jgi:hypothetical protein